MGGSKVSEGVAVSLSLCRVSIPDTIFTLDFPFFLYSSYFYPSLSGPFDFASPFRDTGRKYGPNIHKMSISRSHLLLLHIGTPRHGYWLRPLKTCILPVSPGAG